MSIPRPGGATPPSGETPTELIRTPMSAAAPKRGAIIAGKYRLDRLIARGGMGAVWEAWDTTLERRVAIKFMDPEIASRPLLRARFNREAKAAARLRTPHVVQIIEHGVDGDTPFIVMELLEGEDLQRRLRREKRIPLPDLVPIVRQMAKGLRAAHESGIIHRDLKPQNVFLARQDGDLCVKILDFGVAKVADMPSAAGEATKTGVIVGSPHYMSPEQARGLPTFDQRSDLWSFGVIIFKALTGHRPFKGDAAGDVIVKICAEPLPHASRAARGIPRLIDRFFERALEREVDRRFQTALELAQAFEDYVDEILEDDLKTERWVLPSGGAPSDSFTSVLPQLTPATALSPMPAPVAESAVAPAEAPATPLPPPPAHARLPSKPGVIAPPDPDAPAPPVSDGACEASEVSQSTEVQTPVTGHTPVTGSSESGFAGTVYPSPDEGERRLAAVRQTRRVAIISGVTAGALLLVAVAAMAISSAPHLESGLSARAQALAAGLVGARASSSADEQDAVPESSASAPAARDEQESETEHVVEPPTRRPTGRNLHRPRPIRPPPEPPESSALTESTASASAAPEPPAPPPPPRPRPRPSKTADWGY